MVFAVYIHIARYDRIELAFTHFAYIDNFAFEVERTFGYAYRFDLFCGYRFKAEFLKELNTLDKKARKISRSNKKQKTEQCNALAPVKNEVPSETQ